MASRGETGEMRVPYEVEDERSYHDLICGVGGQLEKWSCEVTWQNPSAVDRKREHADRGFPVGHAVTCLERADGRRESRDGD